MMPRDNELITTVFQTEVTVLAGAETPDGIVPLGAKLPNGSAFSRFIVADRNTMTVSIGDRDEFRRFLVECRGKRGFGAVRTIFGSFAGFGIIGILVVLVSIAASLVIGIYAFIAAAPIVAGVALLDFFERKIYREAGSKFLEYLSDEVPWGFRGDMSVFAGLPPPTQSIIIQESEQIA